MCSLFKKSLLTKLFYLFKAFEKYFWWNLHSSFARQIFTIDCISYLAYLINGSFPELFYMLRSCFTKSWLFLTFNAWLSKRLLWVTYVFTLILKLKVTYWKYTIIPSAPHSCVVSIKNFIWYSIPFDGLKKHQNHLCWWVILTIEN